MSSALARVPRVTLGFERDSPLAAAIRDVLATASGPDAALLDLASRRGLATADTLRVLKAALGAGGASSADERLKALLRGCRPTIAVVDPAAPAASAPSAAAAATPAAAGVDPREAWREEMRARQAHRDYGTLTADIRKQELEQKQTDSFATYNQQMSVGFNVILSLLTATAFGYYLGKHVFGVHNPNAGWVTGLIFGVGLMIVEVTIIMLRLSSADAGKARRNAQMQQPSLAAVAARGIGSGGGVVPPPAAAAAAAAAASAPAAASVAPAAASSGEDGGAGTEYTGSSRVVAASGLRRRATAGSGAAQ